MNSPVFPVTLLFAIALFAVFIAASTIRIAKEYERAVVFRLGRLIPLKGPGLFFVFPVGIDHVRKVDLRVIALEVPQQEVITSDNVTVKVNAVIFFQVMDAQAAIVRVYNFMEATSQIAQTTLRAVLGQSSLDELLGVQRQAAGDHRPPDRAVGREGRHRRAEGCPARRVDGPRLGAPG